jgi:hypothetical protein
MEDENKNSPLNEKATEPMGEMIEEISNSIKKKEIQNQVLRKIVLEINQQIKKKSL